MADIIKYNVELTGDEVKKRLHRDVIFKSTTAWDKDNYVYPESSLLIYTDNNNNHLGIKLADGENAAAALPFVSTGSQSYWKSLD